MYRILASLVMSLATASAFAQYTPRIAYVEVAGSTHYLTLANQDGSYPVRVFASSKKTYIAGIIDLAPVGNRVAFSHSGTLKVLTYAVTGNGIAVTNMISLDASTFCDSPDFSPDGNQILYAAHGGSTELRVAPADGSVAPHTVIPPRAGRVVSSGRWMNSGTQIAYRTISFPPQVTPIREMNLASLDGNGTVIDDIQLFSDATAPFADIDEIDTARTHPWIIFTAGTATQRLVLKYDLEMPGIFEDLVVRGQSPHFSSDDSKIIHVGPSQDGVYVYDRNSNSNTRLVAKKRSDYEVVDWRP